MGTCVLPLHEVPLEMMELSSRELVKRSIDDGRILGLGVGYCWFNPHSGIPPMSWHRADLTTPTWNRKSRDFRWESAGEMVGWERC